MSLRWEATSSSARGAAHERDGRPNQDAAVVRPLHGPAGPALLAAVADGHGGPRYVRSDQGARLAVELAAVVGEGWWLRHGHRRADVEGEQALAEELMGVVVARWREEVRAMAAAAPFTPEELGRAGGPLPDPLEAYGATLLVAVAGPQAVWLAQLGDGDVVVGLTGGQAVRPVPGDDRLVGGQTTSLALSTAVTDVRVASMPAAAAPELVLLASDGYGNSFADDRWYHAVARDLQDQLRTRGLAHVGQRLPGWLLDSARAGGDDVTVVALHATPDPGAHGPSSPPPPPLRGRRRRRAGRALPAVVVATALGAGAAGGWAVRGGGAGEASSAGTATTVANPVPMATVATTALAPGSREAPLGADEAELVAPDRRVIRFRVDAQPSPRVVDVPTDAAVVLALAAPDGRTFAIDDGGLVAGRPGALRAVDLDDEVGALAWAGGTAWVLTADGDRLGRVEVRGSGWAVRWTAVAPLAAGAMPGVAGNQDIEEGN